LRLDLLTMGIVAVHHPSQEEQTMSVLKRLALVVSIALGGSLAIAAVAIAAGGGLAPGDYVFTSASANAQFGTGKGAPPGQPGISVFVNRGLNSFQPEHPKGPKTVTNSTMVQLSVFTSTGGIGGCWVINPSDFTVSKDLQSAALHTTLTADNMCPGPGAPVTGKSDVVPFAGGGEGGLSLPITLDVKWSGLGVTSVERDRGSFKCLNYSADSTNVLHSSNASASAIVSGLSGTFASDLAGVSSTDSHIDINGTPPPACFGV
jgi:hypothetical protein